MANRRFSEKELRALMVERDKEHYTDGGDVRDAILGANDGFVSILGLVSGVAGGSNSSGLVVLAGAAGAFAAAVSMALGNYISVKSQIEVYRAEVEKERYEMEHYPQVEELEIRDIYRERGLRGKALDDVVRAIVADKNVWLNVMLVEELGFKKGKQGDPMRSALITGGAFTVAAVFPILPYVLLPIQSAITFSLVLTLAGVFIMGALKSKLTKLNWLESGLEMVVIAGVAAGVSYFVGQWLGVHI